MEFAVSMASSTLSEITGAANCHEQISRLYEIVELLDKNSIKTHIVGVSHEHR